MDVRIDQQPNMVKTTVVAEIVTNPQRNSVGTPSPSRQQQQQHRQHQQQQQQPDDESTAMLNGGDQMSQNVIKLSNTENGDVATSDDNNKSRQVITDETKTCQPHVDKSSFHEAEPHIVAKSFHEVDVSTNCPSVPLTYDTTYPVFTGQTEYGQEGVHVEPFYRYRVYSESKV